MRAHHPGQHRASDRRTQPLASILVAALLVGITGVCAEPVDTGTVTLWVEPYCEIEFTVPFMQMIVTTTELHTDPHHVESATALFRVRTNAPALFRTRDTVTLHGPGDLEFDATATILWNETPPFAVPPTDHSEVTHWWTSNLSPGGRYAGILNVQHQPPGGWFNGAIPAGVYTGTAIICVETTGP